MKLPLCDMNKQVTKYKDWGIKWSVQQFWKVELKFISSDSFDILTYRFYESYSLGVTSALNVFNAKEMDFDKLL